MSSRTKCSPNFCVYQLSQWIPHDGVAALALSVPAMPRPPLASANVAAPAAIFAMKDIRVPPNGTTTVLRARMKGDHPPAGISDPYRNNYGACWRLLVSGSGLAEMLRISGQMAAKGAWPPLAQRGVTQATRFRYKSRSRDIGGMANIRHWSPSLLCRARFKALPGELRSPGRAAFVAVVACQFAFVNGLFETPY